MTRRVLVTGASGFVARALFALRPQGFEFVAVSRQAVEPGAGEWKHGPSLSASADWRALLAGVDAVVHLAGRVHLVDGGDPALYSVENSDGTAKLAQDALSAGVSHFIFMSTAKVLGDESGSAALAEDAIPRPPDPYAASKFAAERVLGELAGPMKLTVLRPPLVYGPGVRANFRALLAAVEAGVPLPFASIRNRRSLIGVDNLASAIIACLESNGRERRTYHVTDGPALSTPALVTAVAAALGKRPRLFPFPPALLEHCGKILGRGETVKRLTRSLELDDSFIRADLGWRAPRTLDEGLAETARWYLSLREGGG